jgi:hypothetical protein
MQWLTNRGNRHAKPRKGERIASKEIFRNLKIMLAIAIAIA